MVKRRTPPDAETTEDPFPVPTTSRTLRPRSHGRATTASRSPSIHSGASTPALDKGKGKMREDSTHPDSQSSSTTSELTNHEAKRIKLDPGAKPVDKGKGKMRAEETEIESEEEVDQLAMSDSEHDHTGFVGHSVSRTYPTPWDGGSSRSAQEHHSPQISPIVSSPSLAKLLHSTNFVTTSHTSSSSSVNPVLSREEPTGSTLATTTPHPSASSSQPPQGSSSQPLPSTSQTQSSPLDESTLLSAYTCPVCFSPPTNATLTPCGHVLCGSCLFAAVKAGLQRSVTMMVGDGQPMCPVCRAPIPGWDGKGGGVIGLKVRAIISM